MVRQLQIEEEEEEEEADYENGRQNEHPDYSNNRVTHLWTVHKCAKGKAKSA